MRNDSNYIYRLFLALSDIFSLLLSFTIAYILRVTLLIGSSNAPHLSIPSKPYITSVALLLPLWLLLFYMLGLYTSTIYTNRSKEIGRLFVAAMLGVVMMISFSYYTNTPLFPSQLVSIYAFAISFVVLIASRAVLRYIRLKFLDHGIGAQKLLIVGNNETIEDVINIVADNPRTGYKIVGVVTKMPLPLTIHEIKSYPTLQQAFDKQRPDVIIQTDTHESNLVYETAVDHHAVYRYIPSHKALANSLHTSDVMGSLPIITVHTTPLVGYGRFVKRSFDIVISLLTIVVTSPLMILIAVLVKMSDPKGHILMSGVMANRVTRFNKVFRLYKFRSHYAKFDGKTDEEVFQMIGKPELIEAYRANGDKLKKDFRVTPVGSFIRRFSLDELPQLFNVLKGDLSLVGPRALVPHEIDKYERWHTILSVKSGMTGLAVVSGRRSISFKERRDLDVYYVQNWTFWLDISILLKTLLIIFKDERA